MQTIQVQLTKAKTFILKHDAVLAVALAIVIIAVGLFISWDNNKVVPTHPDTYGNYRLEPNNPLSFMSAWDGPIYMQIATHGYTATNANFFPLYPLLVHIVNLVISSPLVSGYIVAWSAMAGAIYFYLKILKRLFSIRNPEAIRGLMLFVLFPTAMFMLATYTESLFACLSLGAIYFALRKKYVPAAILTLLASATHVNAVFVIILVMLVLWEEGIEPRKVALTGAIGSLGLIGYAYYCHVKFHSWLEFVTAQKAHGWLGGGQRHGAFSDITVLNVFFIILIIAAALYWWRRRKSFAIYTALFLLIPLLGRQFGGFNRYVFAAFPIPLMFYACTRKKPTAYAVVLALSTILWTFTLLEFAGGWTGN